MSLVPVSEPPQKGSKGIHPDGPSLDIDRQLALYNDFPGGPVEGLDLYFAGSGIQDRGCLLPVSGLKSFVKPPLVDHIVFVGHGQGSDDPATAGIFSFFIEITRLILDAKTGSGDAQGQGFCCYRG
jgi:hypothetical protein